MKTYIIASAVGAGGVLIGAAVGFWAGGRVTRRAFWGMIREGVINFGPDYPRANRLAAQANAGFMREQEKRKGGLILRP